MQPISHISIYSTCNVITNGNQRYFHIKLQLLHLCQNITYTHHYFKCMVVIKPYPISYYLIIN